MNREEFLAKLSQLLADISEEERKEALEFYQNYFEDAGIENEARVLGELESPEKVAQSIREGCITQELMKLEPTENQKDTTDNATEATDKTAEGDTKHRVKPSFLQEHPVAGILIILLLLAGFSGICIPALGGVFGFLAGVFGVLIGMVVFFAALAMVFLVCGITLVVAGIAMIIATPAVGLVLIGAGLLSVVAGILNGIVEVLICGKFLPWLCRELRKLWIKIFPPKEVAA